MLKIRLAWLWWPRVRHVLPWLRVIWLVDLTCERHEREFCTRPFKITELEKGRWSWISNCDEAFHTDSWLAEANTGHSDRDAILKALLPGPRTVVLFGPGKARMRYGVYWDLECHFIFLTWSENLHQQAWLVCVCVCCKDALHVFLCLPALLTFQIKRYCKSFSDQSVMRLFGLLLVVLYMQSLVAIVNTAVL